MLDLQAQAQASMHHVDSLIEPISFWQLRLGLLKAAYGDSIDSRISCLHQLRWVDGLGVC